MAYVAANSGATHIVGQAADGTTWSYANAGGVVHATPLPSATKWMYDPGLSYGGWGKVSCFSDWSLHGNQYHHCHWQYPMDYSHYQTWPQHYHYSYHNYHHQHHLEMKNLMSKKLLFSYDPFSSSNYFNSYYDTGAYTSKSIWGLKSGLLWDPSFHLKSNWQHDYNSFGFSHGYYPSQPHFDTGFYTPHYYPVDTWGGSFGSHCTVGSGLIKYGALKGSMLLGSGFGCHGFSGLDTLAHVKAGTYFTGGLGGFNGFGGHGFGGCW